MALNIRMQMILDAMSVSATADCNLEGLRKVLPENFELEQIDLDELPAIGSMLATVPVAGELAAVEVDDTFLDAEPIALTADQAQAALDKAHEDLDAARQANMKAHYDAKVATAAVADCTTQFQSGFQKYSADELRRDFCRQEAIQRGLVAQGLAPPSTVQSNRPGPSVIDRMAFGRGSIEHGRLGSWKQAAKVAAEKKVGIGPWGPAQKLLTRKV